MLPETPVCRTRLAPSPTGALHLGNARTFLVNWALARQHGWEIVLRVDDLDGPRVKAVATEQAIEDLRWLGVDWDVGPLFQTTDLTPYKNALRRLWADGHIYPCDCTRSQIEAASAPQEGVLELRYGGICRDTSLGDSPPRLQPSTACWRVRCPDHELAFVDQFAGPQSQNVQRQVGDFPVLTKAGFPSYQLATVVDDHRQGITHVVRGDDLIDSTLRQIHLQELLRLEPGDMMYWHLPIVVGVDGRRLAKRHGDSRLSHYRELGVPAERIMGLLRSWCGGPREPCSPQAFLDGFSVDQISTQRVVMAPSDDRWLLAGVTK